MSVQPNVSVRDDDSAPGPVGEPGGFGETGGFGFRLIVSPAAGRLRHLPPARFHDGDEWVGAGQPVAFVEQGSLSIEVVSPVEARVAGVLVRDGEPVLRGQPVVWLEESPLRPGPQRR